MSGMKVTFRIHKDETELNEFFSKIPQGKRTKVFKDAMKLYIYNLDKSVIDKDMKNLQNELDQLKSIMDWQKNRLKWKDEQFQDLLDNKRLDRWLKWYNEKYVQNITIADNWLEMVIKDIGDDIGYDLTTDDLKAIWERKLKNNVSIDNFKEEVGGYQ